MKIDQKVIVKDGIEIKTVSMYLKVSDSFSCQIKDDQGKIVKDYDGYVPKFMPGEHYGDYVILEIDIDTGHVINWKRPSQEVMAAFISDGEEEN
jgi:hypothetical protein